MRWLLALGATVITVLLLELIAQLALPGIAAQRIRDQLSKSGKVTDVQVSAFPAVELLWQHADSVTVRMASYRSNTAHLSSLLHQSSQAGTVHASAAVMTDGLLTLHNASLTKQGNVLTGSAQVNEADLRRAVPFISSVTPIASSGGVLTLRGTANIPFVGQIIVPFVVQVLNGTLVATPEIPLVSAFTTVRLFSDPHIAIQSLTARVTPGGFAVQARGTLR